MRIMCSETSGITILLIGIVLLLVTFVIASIHLQGEINVLPVPSFLSSFGETFSPLIEASIRVLYLVAMGWIATSITAKGLTIVLQSKLLDNLRVNSEK